MDSEASEENYISISSKKKKLKGNRVYTNKLCVSWHHKMPLPEAELDEKQQDVVLLKNCDQADKGSG